MTLQTETLSMITSGFLKQMFILKSFNSVLYISSLKCLQICFSCFRVYRIMYFSSVKCLQMYLSSVQMFTDVFQQCEIFTDIYQQCEMFPYVFQQCEMFKLYRCISAV